MSEPDEPNFAEANTTEPNSGEPRQLVFALCHEVGNLLAASRMQADLLDPADDASEIERAAGTISQLASRMGSLVALIRPILSEPSRSPEVLDPLDVFEGLQRSLDESCDERVRFNLRSAVELPCAVIEESVLHHLLLVAIYSGLEDSDPTGVVAVSAGGGPDKEPRELSFFVESQGPDRQASGALRGPVLAQSVADAVLRARGGRTATTHRNGSNRVEVTVPAGAA